MPRLIVGSNRELLSLVEVRLTIQVLVRRMKSVTPPLNFSALSAA